jgi:nucleoside-diphosphate-sugar epimerase
VCLRLPDVIGPYDNTYRFWTTLMWLQRSEEYPMCVSAADEAYRLSMVDSLSVATMIVELVKRQEAMGEAYNLGFEETCTLTEFIEMLVRMW